MDGGPLIVGRAVYKTRDTLDEVLLDGDVLDLTIADAGHELAVGELGRSFALLPEHREQEEHHDEDDHPERHVLVKLLVHSVLPIRSREPVGSIGLLYHSFIRARTHARTVHVLGSLTQV